MSADEIHVRILSDVDAVIARQRGREVAMRLGFSRTDATFVATAISEIARNITAHAGTGEITIRGITENGRDGIMVVAEDEGPGIRDVAAVMRRVVTTGQGLGVGLWGARRLMDAVDVTSELGHGTTVTMKKWCRFDEVGRLLED
jgi:serine/threonine-protein kinase RsbT